MRREESAGCFDVAGAEYPTRVVEVDQVVDLLVVSHAPERVAAYRQAMAAGARFPPIAVLRCGRRFLIADGHKRFSAYRQLSAAPLPVEVWPAHRWLRDQWRQLRRTTGRWARLLRGGVRDAQNRHAARQLLVDTAAHWRRIARSLCRVGAGGGRHRWRPPRDPGDRVQPG